MTELRDHNLSKNIIIIGVPDPNENSGLDKISMILKIFTLNTPETKINIHKEK